MTKFFFLTLVLSTSSSIHLSSPLPSGSPLWDSLVRMGFFHQTSSQTTSSTWGSHGPPNPGSQIELLTTLPHQLLLSCPPSQWWCQHHPIQKSGDIQDPDFTSHPTASQSPSPVDSKSLLSLISILSSLLLQKLSLDFHCPHEDYCNSLSLVVMPPVLPVWSLYNANVYVTSLTNLPSNLFIASIVSWNMAESL